MQNTHSEQNCQHGQQLTSASFFLLGIAVGSAAALLFTPLAGKNLRNLIGERVDEGRKAVKVQARETWDKAARAAEEAAAGVTKDVTAKVEAGKRFVSEEGRKVEAAIQAGKQAYKEGASL